MRRSRVFGVFNSSQTQSYQRVSWVSSGMWAPNLCQFGRHRSSGSLDSSAPLRCAQNHYGLVRPRKRDENGGGLVPVDSRFRGNDGVGLPSIFIAITMALRRPHKRNENGRTLRLVPCGFRPRIGVRGRLFAGMTFWPMSSIFIAMTGWVCLLFSWQSPWPCEGHIRGMKIAEPSPSPLWIPAPYRGTGPDLRRSDGWVRRRPLKLRRLPI